MNYGRLRYKDGWWCIDGLPPHAIIRLKDIFKKIPKAQSQPYLFKDTLENSCDLEWFESRYPLEMSAVDRLTLRNFADLMRVERVKLERVLSGDYQPLADPRMREIDPDTGKPNELHPLQALAVRVHAQSRGLLLADEVGSGKSWVAAGTALTPGALPLAIVCYPHLQKQWRRVIERFTNLRVVEISKTKVQNVPEADVYIFRYTQLAGWADHFGSLNLKAVVYDEVQELRTGLGEPSKPVQKGVGAQRLSRQCTFRLGLSATPIYNYGVEIWNIMQFLNEDLLGAKDDFLREWAPHGHVEDPDALSAYMKGAGAFLRRLKKDFGQSGDPPNKIIQEIGFDHKTLADAEVLARELAISATTGSFMDRGMAARELDARMRKATGVAKAHGIASFIRIVVESGQKVIVGLWHREVYDILLRALNDLRPVMYTGSESPAQKEASKATFLKPFSDGGSDILLMSNRSGAGLDGLQFVCSTAIIGELDWSPAIYHQFIGRIWDRPGQTEPVTAFFLTVPEGSDPTIMEVNGVKASEAAAIIDSGLGPQQIHTDASALQKLVAKYLKR